MNQTTDMAGLDQQIAEAERELMEAQNRYRSRPRIGISLGQGPARIDPASRANMLDLGLDVDRAAIRLEQLKKQRAELLLAELSNLEEIAAEDAAVDAAHAELTAAEAALAEIRLAYRVAAFAKKDRADRIKTQRAEVARATAAICSAEKVADREQTERAALNVA